MSPFHRKFVFTTGGIFLLGIGFLAREALLNQASEITRVGELAAKTGSRLIDDAYLVRVLALRCVMAENGAAAYALADHDCMPAFKRDSSTVVPYSKERFTSESGFPAEKASGRRFTVLTIDFCRVEGESAKIAIIAWSGNVGIVGHILTLKKAVGVWVVESKKVQAIATNWPNKAPEPTTMAVTPRAMIEMKSQNPNRDVTRGAPAMVVAHL